MHFPCSDDQIFRWIGAGVVRRKTRFGVEVNFQEFEHGDLRVAVGDHILIGNDDSVDREDIKRCFVARVECLYQRGNSGEDCNRAVVQWYSRLKEVCRPGLLAFIKQFPTPTLPELVLEKRSYPKDLDAETIFEKCMILETDPVMTEVDQSKVESGLPCFVVRFHYNGITLKPIRGGTMTPKRPATKSISDCTGFETPTKTTVSEVKKNGSSSTSKENKQSPFSPFKSFYSPRRSQSVSTVSPVRRLVLESPAKAKAMINEIDEVVSRKSVSVKTPQETKRGKYQMEENVATTTRLQRKVGSAKKKLLQDDEKVDNKKMKIIRTRSGRKVTWSVQPKRNSSGSSSDNDSVFSLKQCDESGDISSSDSEVDDDTENKPIVSDRKTRKRSSTKSQGAVKSKTPKSKRCETPVARIPARNQSCPVPETHTNSVLDEVRARLHVSVVPDTLPCRAKEFTLIYAFVQGKIIDGTGGCMYISGVPGTGKTATVLEVIRSLKQSLDYGEIPPFTFIDINGMKLTDPRQSYVQIYNHLTGQKVTAAHAVQLLEKRFSKSGPRRETVVLLVDELDLLWTRRQDVMYSLFDWPGRPHSRLIILAIANTMDLPERIMTNRVSSRLGLTRLTFHPYSYKQLQEILESRLGNFVVFDQDALQLVARKVAAMSGDARRALDICRRATELNVDVSATTSPRKRQGVIIGMGEVDCAIQEMFSSPKVEAIRYASVQEQIFLQAVVAEFQRVGLEEAPFVKIYKQHLNLCRIQGFETPNVSQASSICCRLSSCRLLLLEKTANDLNQRIRLNVSTDDINFALKLL